MCALGIDACTGGVGRGVLPACVADWTCFFFSSRRRHTRFDCDWSSDVCSSDLAVPSFGSASDPTETFTIEVSILWLITAKGDLPRKGMIAKPSADLFHSNPA